MTDAFAMTAPDVKVYHVESLLDPELVNDLCRSAVHIGELDAELGNEKWNIAGLVLSGWDEHKNITYPPAPGEAPVQIFPTITEYYAECSRVANTTNRRKVFGESGQTLRRWCEVRATYSTFDKAELFLDALSFDHLYKARKLYLDGCVKNPVLALAKAQSEGWSADEMELHYKKDGGEVYISFLDRAASFFDRLTKTMDWSDEKKSAFNDDLSALVRKYL